jgi:leader peptidase (prepilin peptidase)/N-methyltransferase
MVSTVEAMMVFILLGLIFGSFATALSYRLPQGLPIGRDRSRCPKCGTVLGVADLVPLLSWMMSRGRCRHCGQAISWRYPMIELVVTLLFAVACWQGDGDLLGSSLMALTAFALVVIAVADLECGIIPDAMLLFMVPLAVLWRWHDDGGWIDAACGAVVGIVISYGLRWGFRRWRGKDGLGLGDVKFIGIAGWYLGLSGLGDYLLLSGLLGLLMGIGWRLSGRGAAFPFGPALCASLLLGVFQTWELVGLGHW